MRIGFRHRRRGMLEKMLTEKRAETARMRAGLPHLPAHRPGGGVLEALTRGGRTLRWMASGAIGSQSGGNGAQGGDPEARALRAAEAGASAIWVTTDALFLGGSYEDLARCRRALEAALGNRRPRLVGEDLIVDAVQLDRAAGAGADAVLLVAKALPLDALYALVAAAGERSLTPIVEAASEAEARSAIQAGARLIGASSINRDTHRRSAEQAIAVLQAVRLEATTLHLHGIESAEEAVRIASLPADAALLPESLWNGAGLRGYL